MKFQSTIAFIGGGNMARSLIGRLARHVRPPESISVAEPIDALREALQLDFGVTVFADNIEAVSNAGIWVLAVKPQMMRTVCESLSSSAQIAKPLIVSIAAGVTTAQIQRWFDMGAALPVIRAMPNTPALLGAGATGLYATDSANAYRAEAEALLSATSSTTWINDETQMDAVTAISGSGPAYVFLLAEAMIAAGEAEGLTHAAACELTLETVFGAARMLIESGDSPGELRKGVTSPDGTTQAALDSFERDGFRAIVARAIHAARVRGAELSAMND